MQQPGQRYPSFADPVQSSRQVNDNASPYTSNHSNYQSGNFLKNSQMSNYNVQMVQPNLNVQNYQSGLNQQKKNYIQEVNIDKETLANDSLKVRKIKLFSQYKAYGGNQIKSSKYYGMPLFIFQDIWFQMHKLANIYFLVIACLQCIPAISISQGQPVILLPLIVNLILLIKQ